MEAKSKVPWWRWPFRIALLPFVVFWPLQILYLGMKFATGGPRAAMGWLYHINTRVVGTNDSIIIIRATPRSVVVNEVATFALTVCLWWVSGFRIWPWHSKS